MPFDRKAYMKEYREKNKEKMKEYMKDYKKEYSKNNKERIKEVNKIYYQSPVGIKNGLLNTWRQRGVIETDQYTFDELYETYLYHTNCEECNVELTTGRFMTKTTKCLDHDHETGKFRDILCHTCNVKRR